MMMRTVLGLMAVFLLSSCGGVKCYLHDCGGPVASLETVELAVGEEIEAVRITRGGMWGGYHQGLIADDPGVVRVVIREAGMRTDVSLRGLREGETRVYYVNQLAFRHPNSGMAAYRDMGEDARAQSSSFILRVVGGE